MRFVHLSDLHLGKRVNEFSMLEDQAYILKKILKIIEEEKPHAVMIAGDVYDKSIPSVEAIDLFDDFLTTLANWNIPVFIISGNHDSAERVSFGSNLMKSSGVYFSPAYNGKIESIKLNQKNEIDEYGPINVFLMPFLKPAIVKSFVESEEDYANIQTYTDAISYVVQKMNINKSERNILVAHQFVTGATRCDSEDLSVGGSDNVDVNVFDSFDYVALGHLHGPQKAGREFVRYCGTPLKYSFSEVNHKKGVGIVEIEKKGSVIYKSVPLEPLRDMRELKGSYEELTLLKNYENTKTDDYISITLTDENDIPQAFGKLQSIYKNLMKLNYDNQRTRKNNNIQQLLNVEKLSPFEIISNFYKEQNNHPMNEKQEKYMKNLIEKNWEEE